MQIRFATTLLALAICWGAGTALRASEQNPMITGVEIQSQGSDRLFVDKQLQLIPIAIGADDSREIFPGPAAWQVVGSEAEILPNGLLKAHKTGSITVKLKAGSFTAERSFAIEPAPIRVYFHAPDQNWQRPHVWYWYLGGNADVTGRDPAGNPLEIVLPADSNGWPGIALTPAPNVGPNWYEVELPRYDDPEQFPGRELTAQPLRLVFNNGGLGEQTRDFLHYDGCFLRYNTYLDRAQGLIDGRWAAPQDCPAFQKPFRVQAIPAGGPLYGDDSPIYLTVEGPEELKGARYEIAGRPESLSEGKVFNPRGTLLNASQLFAEGDHVRLCLFAETKAGAQQSQCYSYQREKPPQIKTLGTQYTPEQTTFSIWSPERGNVQLWLDGQLYTMGKVQRTDSGYEEVYALSVPGNHRHRPYHFFVDGQVVRDPYGRMVWPGEDFNVVMDLSKTEPEGGWAQRPPLDAREDVVVYEVHVRDFTIHPRSGISLEKKGKFLGMVEANTYLDSDPTSNIKTGISHLKELGVTHVQLLPVFDYATCSKKDRLNGPDCYNWGYDPENFNIPEERYAMDPWDFDQRVKEFKTMVNEFHKAGIRVIMDVVYNHTWTRPFRESDEGEKVFGAITGKYFLHNQQGIGFDLTGTGNTVAGHIPMVGRFIQDSLEYWVQEYQVDGFRFDLAGVFDHHNIAQWMAYLHKRFPDRNLVVYGEPWTALQDLNPRHFRLYHLPQMNLNGQPSHFGGFNFPFREAIKGANNDGAAGGFVFNQATSVIQTVANGLRGSLGNSGIQSASFASDPEQSINYVSSHDNLTLWDRIQAWANTNGGAASDYLERIQKFAGGMVLTAQGIPMLHSGIEMRRTKNGIYDTYNKPDAINALDWGLKENHPDIFAYYKDMIQLRRAHGSLRMENAEEVWRHMNVAILANDFIEVRINQNKKGDEMIVLYNSGQNRNYDLPPGEWQQLAGAGQVWSSPRPAAGRITAEGTAITAFKR